MAQTSDDNTTNTGNVTPLRPDMAPEPARAKPRRKDRPAAARQAKFRSKTKPDRYETPAREEAPTPSAMGSVTPPIAPNVTPPRVDAVTHPVDAVTPPAPVTQPPAERHSGVRFATLTAALSLASVSGYFAITGMTSIFTGAFYPVVGMGVALELGKLSAVAWLGRHRGSPALRMAPTGLVLVLMALNAVGAYGFLAKAHIGHQVDGETAVAGRAADIEARLALQGSLVSDLDRRIGQIDGAIEKATAKGRTSSAMALADQQRKTRGELVAQRTSEARVLVGLQVEK